MAYVSFSGWCELGGQKVIVQGISSASPFQQSFPNYSQSGSGPSVTVYLTGTTTPANLYSDKVGTPLSNPFPVQTNGFWQFYATTGTYDILFSGSGMSPFTISSVSGIDPDDLAQGSVLSVGGTLPISVTPGTTPVVSVATATTSSFGVVKPDGTTIDISAGVIRVPTADISMLGLVQPDGVSIDVSAGLISVPTATSGLKGLVRPDGTTISVSAGNISVPEATASTFGIVKPDNSTITISAGVISAVGGGNNNGSGDFQKIAQFIINNNATTVPTVTFNSIPQNFTHLKLVMSVGSSVPGPATDVLYVQFNGDNNGNHYYPQGVLSQGANVTCSPAYNGNGTNNPAMILVPNANSFGSMGCEMSIPYYSATDSGNANSSSFSIVVPTLVGGWADSNNGISQQTTSLLWAGTTPDTSILIGLQSGNNFSNGDVGVTSVFSLYGLK